MLWWEKRDIELDVTQPGNCTWIPSDRLDIIPVTVTQVSKLKVLSNQDLYNPLVVTQFIFKFFQTS